MKTYETTMLSDKQNGGANLDAEIKRGIAASEAGDKASAEAIFRGIVSRNPNALEAWVWLGWTSASLDDAEAAFTRASTLDPKNEEAQLGIRWVASQRGNQPPPQAPQPAMAAPASRQASPADATLSGDWDLEDAMRRAVAAAQAGNKPTAYAMFRQIAERHPNLAAVWVWCGGTSPTLEDAEMAFSRAQRLEPDNEEANLGLRWVALRRHAADRFAGSNTGPIAISGGATGPMRSESTESTPTPVGDGRQAEADKKLSFFARMLKKLNIPLPALLMFIAAVLVWAIVAVFYLSSSAQ
jgi:tetratricopeptide (TPR) repeat protein